MFAFLCQCDDELELMRRIGMIDHDPLRLDDLDCEILVLVIRAVRSMQRQFPAATGPELKAVERAAESIWSPPARKVLWFGKRAENPLS